MQITEEELKKLLDLYGGVTHKREFLKAQKQELINKVIPPEIAAELEAIDAEFKAKEDALDEEEKGYRKILDGAIADYVQTIPLIDKAKVKSELVTLHITRGETEWDTHALDGMIVAGHKELLPFRKELPPRTRILKNRM